MKLLVAEIIDLASWISSDDKSHGEREFRDVGLGFEVQSRLEVGVFQGESLEVDDRGVRIIVELTSGQSELEEGCPSGEIRGRNEVELDRPECIYTLEPTLLETALSDGISTLARRAGPLQASSPADK
jgi:hypothetical protein